MYIYKHTKHGSSWWWGLVKGRQWFSCFNLPQKVLPFNRELTNFESMVFNDGWKLLGILHPIFHIFLGILLDISYISGDSPRYFIYFWILHGLRPSFFNKTGTAPGMTQKRSFRWLRWLRWLVLGSAAKWLGAWESMELLEPPGVYGCFIPWRFYMDGLWRFNGCLWMFMVGPKYWVNGFRVPVYIYICIYRDSRQ